MLQHKSPISDAHPPDIKKNRRELNQVNEQAALFVHLVLSISTETFFFRESPPQMLEENVAERCHA